MRGVSKKILLIILIALVAIVGITPSTYAGNENTETKEEYWQRKPLTPDDAEMLFPDLPTASEIYNFTSSVYIDLKHYGKRSSDDPYLLFYATEVEINLIIQNYTSNTPDFLHGGVIKNVPHIWLKYNETIWVQVPISHLLTSKSETSTKENDPTWAIGEYSDPAEIAGSNPVSGVSSWGAWGSWSPSDPSYFIGADVLTMHDGVYASQIVEAQVEDTKYVAIQIWYGDQLVGDYWWEVSAGTSQLYMMRIQYARVSQDGWDFDFHGEMLLTLRDGCSQIITGNQPNVVFETNDYIESDFDGYYGYTGGTQQGILFPTIAYYFSGGWKPFFWGDPLPTAYAYHGGSQTNVIFGVGNDPPPIWFGEIGYDFWFQRRPYPEQLWFGNWAPQPRYGQMLWHTP